MNGTMNTFHCSGYDCSVYLPAISSKKRLAVIYLPGEGNLLPLINLIESDGCSPDTIIAGIDTPDWEKDFSPWPAESFSKKGKPFSGGAGQFRSIIEKEIKPYIDKSYPTLSDPEHTALAGYSLAGLFSLYVLYTGRVFGHGVSLSGSFWFPRWIDFISSHTPAETVTSCYFSLGDAEKNSRNQLLSTVETKTLQTVKIVKKTVPSVLFEYTKGGHFQESEKRIVRGLRAIKWPEE